MSQLIPFNKPHKTSNDLINITNAYESNKHCGNGPFSTKAQDWLNTHCNSNSAFLTPSCTAALEMGAVLADINPGDEVILPSYTFSSTANAVILMGAKPVFCDVRPDTMNINEKLIEQLITPKTKLILPIDYAGIPCEIDTITEISKATNIKVLQDAAQSIGSKYNDEPIGSHFDFVAFSFHESKNINCGEGGALLVNDKSSIQRATFVQEKGTDRSLVLKGVRSKYQWVDRGSSYLLSDLLSGMLLSQLEDIDNIIEARSHSVKAYFELFSTYAELKKVQIPIIPKNIAHNCHAFFVIFDTVENQELFLNKLREKNIFAYIGYMPLHSSTMGLKYGYKPEGLPLTNSIGSRIVRLPVYSQLSGNELDYCIENMKAVMADIYGY
jgi:dTDP-4-amino-4,6-dideoxygalactose transaminase